MACPLYLLHYATPPPVSSPLLSRSFQGLRFTNSGGYITISGPDKTTATRTSNSYYSLVTAGDVEVDSDSGGGGYCEVVLESGASSDGSMNYFCGCGATRSRS